MKKRGVARGLEMELRGVSHVKRVEFDPEYVAMLEKEVVQFLTELDDKVNKLTNLKVKNV